ncbi:hypothetical protein DSM106972_056160 [Dulcicalothrix desertica PCC 7102]|uniref:Uncharacterized protein n=1 Tax=Dulcicalothrix desertica PCC 7102 TaxID=232991 RepID=A0A3S1B0V8_9CYAN|nr:hypothetical protein [Dulcicalothrix desertica]RUT02696.1 hypothetical protein DSM106972_056160 [Dulcicalothrix desertica PCC 7102]TWH39070.1 hypothetical protein CAL7102_08274 [Dulcicalothrix desertica PCC 7102]
MDYPLGTVSQRVTGDEARKIAHAIMSGGYVANETAIALSKKIAERRRQKQAANGSQQ